MSNASDTITTPVLTTPLALDFIAWGRAPRHKGGRVNHRVVCADGFKVSIQASTRHYAMDSHPSGDAPYWRDAHDRLEVEVAYPFVSFELGGGSSDLEYPPIDEYDSGGVWAWVPREVVAGLLDAHGGAMGWEMDRA